MPRRSTPIQRVVFQIQRRLAHNASVEESAGLIDRNGTGTREVDIVIRTRLGVHDVVVSIECIEHKRKATVEWVEQMAMKHASLPTSKLVLLSSSGFTPRAIEKAKMLGVETVTLDQAMDTNWQALLGETPIDSCDLFAMRIAGCEIVLAGSSNTTVVAPPQTALYKPSKEYWKSLREHLDSSVTCSPEFTNAALDYAKTTNSTKIVAEYRTEQQFLIRDKDQRFHLVKAFLLVVEVLPSIGPIELAVTKYKGIPVAYTNVETPIGNLTLSMMLPPDAEPIGSLSVSERLNDPAKTVNVVFTPHDPKLLFMTKPLPKEL